MVSYFFVWEFLAELPHNYNNVKELLLAVMNQPSQLGAKMSIKDRS